MSKKITMTARARPMPEVDDWVQSRTTSEPVKPAVKPKRLTIDVDPDLHRKLKLHCVRQDTQIADLLRRLIEAEVVTNTPDFP